MHGSHTPFLHLESCWAQDRCANSPMNETEAFLLVCVHSSQSRDQTETARLASVCRVSKGSESQLNRGQRLDLETPGPISCQGGVWEPAPGMAGEPVGLGGTRLGRSVTETVSEQRSSSTSAGPLVHAGPCTTPMHMAKRRYSALRTKLGFPTCPACQLSSMNLCSSMHWR